ncbi:MAG TPA: hypothetical protein ENG03_08080 [Thioploca sp.]|nr:MAG: hypothetical protein DRR08_00945 [Gammaproteobacteria bacterium]HDN27035.1 hypothetical protein [Thioploca sp.]
MKTAPAAIYFIKKKAAGIESGSKTPHTHKVGKVKRFLSILGSEKS